MTDALKLWFFRDLNDAQRLKLFGLFGFPVEAIGNTHGKQEIALRHVVQKLVAVVRDETIAAIAIPASAPARVKLELVWIQNLKAFIERGLFQTEDWKKIFIEQLDRISVSPISAIAAERTRQIRAGYDEAHDDGHKAGEIITAPWGALARINGAIEAGRHGDNEGYMRRLTQAAAQISAEIERVERAIATTREAPANG